MVDAVSVPMKIQDLTRSQAVTGKRTERKGGVDAGSGFSALLGADDAPAAAGTGSAGPVASVGMILAVQQVEDATQGRSRGLARGHDLLDELDKMQKSLLLGDLSIGQLQHLAAKVRTYEKVSDPQLSEILAEIELRVAVELAKYGIEITG